MKIRRARKSDANQVAKLYLQFWKFQGKINPIHQIDFSINFDNCLKDTLALIRDKDYNLYVAEEESRILGFILFTIKTNPLGFKVRKYGFLEETAVDKAHRGKGIATKMLDFALNYFKKHNLKYVSGSVEINNKLALTVWQKLGFKQASIDLIRELR